MLIGGLQKFSLLDYPEKISTIIFTHGCNFRCAFCYNPTLVNTKTKDDIFISEKDFFIFLKSRIKKIDAVVISGGEPTMQDDLEKFISKIKKLKFLVKLDTNGTNPEILKNLISKKLIDYIAMDVKAGLKNYEKVVKVKINQKKIKESIDIIMNAGLPYEFRTTVVPGLVKKDDILQIGKLITGAQKWFLQKFKSDIDLVDKSFYQKKSFTDQEMIKMKKTGEKYVQICKIR